ncbi:hypothetical protein BFW01_g12789 [Lasiodiplodia theobromae]|nr:hypothetical protein BFW01_g12789 [Lasiodiplodia theobromae]
MQAELVSLEKRLRKVQARDNAAPGSRSLYATNWFYLGNSTYQDDGDDSQWELVKEIREKLKEYNELLIQQLKIVSVIPPGTSDLRYIQSYLQSEDMDNGILTGQDAVLWGSIERPKEHAPDLLALLGRKSGEDFFSRWVTDSVADKMIELQQRLRLARPSGPSGEPQPLKDERMLLDKKLLRWTFMLASGLASALPILSIVILYWVRSTEVRLGLIAVFNIVLSFTLACFTSAKRAEVFAVSAAFSAVCVVFVQGGTDGLQDVSS